MKRITVISFNSLLSQMELERVARAWEKAINAEYIILESGGKIETIDIEDIILRCAYCRQPLDHCGCGAVNP